jgi:nucleoside-diphosphate-sugar epimerase
MKTILVTGGAGFVGSHACKALARAGFLPVVFDSLEHGHDWAVKWGPLERGDVRNEQDLARVFAARQPLGGNALRRLCLCRRIRRCPGEVLRQQYRRHCEAHSGMRGP